MQPRMTRQMLQAFPRSVRYIEVDGEHNLLNPTSQTWKHVQKSLSDFITVHNPGANI